MSANKGFTISEILLVFAAVFLVVVLILPVVKYNRNKWEKTICANNLREIGTAIYIYAGEHEGSFPSSLKTLYDEGYLSDEGILDCPGNRTEGTIESPDYIYTAGLSVKNDSLSFLARDKAKNHRDDGKNVLFVNGAVIWTEAD